LLSETQPDHPWDETDNRILRYTYEFMPKGIVTRFIVAMHPYIYQQEYVWRSGVILQNQDKDTRAEVIEYYGKREINIRLLGKQKRDLMTVINHEFQKIHDSYPGLEYKQLIPCKCSECQNSQHPHLFNLQTLKNFQKKQKPTITCENSTEDVNVSSLIDDVLNTTKLSQLEPDREKFISGEYTSGFQEELDSFSKDSEPSHSDVNININLDNKSQAMSQNQGDTNQSGNFGVGFNQGEIKDNAKVAGIYKEAEQQNLVQEIQQLLEKLEQTYGTDTATAKMRIATEATKEIENNQPLKQRILQALKAGGISALEQSLNHPAASFVIDAIKDFRHSEPSS